MGKISMGIRNILHLEAGDTLELRPRPHCAITNMDFDTKYELLDELGKGMFGVVKRCKNKETGEQFAAKIVRKTTKSKKEVSREIAMMNQLHHKKLAQIHDAFETSRQMIIVMEYIPGEELFEKVIQDDRCLTELQVVMYMKQILYGVQHMHKKSIVHLDLKPENILCIHGGIPGYEEIKLIDFGLAREIKPGSQETALCGTPEFVSPEVISYDPISMSSDMWSLGVITYVLLSGMSPFLGDDDNETLQNVTAGEYEFEDEDDLFDNVSDEAKLFIKKLLQLNPRKRMTVEDCLDHEWLSDSENKEHIIDTTNLKKYLARRKWKKTINAIKAVGRFSLGLSLFKNKSKIEEGNKDCVEKIEETEKENNEIILDNTALSANKLIQEGHSKKEMVSSSSDEGISDGDIEKVDRKGEIERASGEGEPLNNTKDRRDLYSNGAEDSGCFDVDFNNNSIEQEENLSNNHDSSRNVSDDSSVEKLPTESNVLIANNINETHSELQSHKSCTIKNNIKQDLPSKDIVEDKRNDDVIVIPKYEREKRRSSRAEERSRTNSNKIDEYEGIENIILKEEVPIKGTKNDRNLKGSVRTEECSKIEKRKVSFMKNEKRENIDNILTKAKETISENEKNKSQNLNETAEAMNSTAIEKRKTSFTKNEKSVNMENSRFKDKKHNNVSTQGQPNNENSIGTEKRRVSMFSRFNRGNSKTGTDISDFDKTVGTPLLNRRTSSNVLPSQLRRAKTQEEIVLQSVDEKQLNIGRSVGENTLRSSLRRFKVDENGNDTSKFRKKSLPLRKMSVKDRMALFQNS